MHQTESDRIICSDELKEGNQKDYMAYIYIFTHPRPHANTHRALIIREQEGNGEWEEKKK